MLESKKFAQKLKWSLLDLRCTIRKLVDLSKKLKKSQGLLKENSKIELDTHSEFQNEFLKKTFNNEWRTLEDSTTTNILTSAQERKPECRVY